MSNPDEVLKPRLRQIARALLAKTRAGQVNWTRPSGTDLRYEVALPGCRIVLEYLSPVAEPDRLSLQIRTVGGFAGGFAVGSLEADEPEPESPINATEDWEQERAEQEADWQLLKPLFDEVHRFVTGWDKVVADIEAALASPGIVGAPAKREPAQTAR